MIEYLRNSFNFKKIYQKNDEATRGASACAARATSTNIQFSIVNSGLSGLGIEELKKSKIRF
jgi:hypothetical protein